MPHGRKKNAVRNAISYELYAKHGILVQCCGILCE